MCRSLCAKNLNFCHRTGIRQVDLRTQKAPEATPATYFFAATSVQVQDVPYPVYVCGRSRRFKSSRPHILYSNSDSQRGKNSKGFTEVHGLLRRRSPEGPLRVANVIIIKAKPQKMPVPQRPPNREASEMSFTFFRP